KEIGELIMSKNMQGLIGIETSQKLCLRIFQSVLEVLQREGARVVKPTDSLKRHRQCRLIVGQTLLGRELPVDNDDVSCPAVAGSSTKTLHKGRPRCKFGHHRRG